MLRLNRILVPRDGSHCSEQALDEALLLALNLGAELHILHVDVLLGEPVQLIDDTFELDVAQERLRQVAHLEPALAGRAESVRIVRKTERGFSAAPVIAVYAEQHDIGFILIGTHARRGMRRLLAGSVAEEVVRLSPCPVLTVHARELGKESVLHARSILVPVDFSTHSLQALRLAAEWAGLTGAILSVLHVIDDYVQPATHGINVLFGYDSVRDAEVRSRTIIQQMVKEALGESRPVIVYAIPGRASHRIVEFASEHASDLIVMSTHGLTGAQHLLLGSVAETVVRHAPCPVLTQRAFQGATATPVTVHQYVGVL